VARSPITKVDGITRTKESKIIIKEDVFVTGGKLGLGKRKRKFN